MVGRIEELKRLGIKANKMIPAALIAENDSEEEGEEEVKELSEL